MSWFERYAQTRPPDFVIGDPARPYLLRWWLLPRNRLFNVYLHWILRSDDDRALHDHPWMNVSYLLRGGYVEHRIAAGGVHHARVRQQGSIIMRRARVAHRLELVGHDACWTLFITGPTVRAWGFHCPAGWRPWQIFTSHEDKGQVGRGCE